MYTAKTTTARINSIIKKMKVTQKQMLSECNLSQNILYQMTDNKGIGCFALACIADYLNTSTDYLLGRTDEPSMTVSVNNTNATITAPQTNGNENVVIAESPPISEDVRGLINIVLTLTPIDRAKALLYVDSLRQEEAKRNPPANV